MRRLPAWVISRKKLKQALEQHPDWENPLNSWFMVAENAEWRRFADVRRTFSSADVVGTCTVFNVGGNKCRLITWINYKEHRVFIRSVLSHAEYDKGKWKDDCNCN